MTLMRTHVLELTFLRSIAEVKVILAILCEFPLTIANVNAVVGCRSSWVFGNGPVVGHVVLRRAMDLRLGVPMGLR